MGNAVLGTTWIMEWENWASVPISGSYVVCTRISDKIRHRILTFYRTTSNNDGGLTESGVEKVTKVYKDELKRIQRVKKRNGSKGARE